MARKKLVAPLSEKAGRPFKSENLSKYSAVAAAQLGVDERTVRNDLRRATKIEADVMAEVTGTALDKGVVLDELARTAPADQADEAA
jgi:hypothetical protein